MKVHNLSENSSRYSQTANSHQHASSSSNAYMLQQHHKPFTNRKIQQNNNINTNDMTTTTTTTNTSPNDDDQYTLDYIYNNGDDMDDTDAMNAGNCSEDNNVVQTTATNSSLDITTKTMIEFFVSIDQPLAVFDNYRLRAFIADLNPSYALPTSNSVEFDLLPELVSSLEDEARVAFTTNVDYVAITTKSFTSSSNLEYLSIETFNGSI